MKETGNWCTILLLSFVLGGCVAKNLTADREQAFLAYKQGDFENASQQLELLVQEVPKDPELWFKLGNSYARAQYPQKAIEAYQNALLRDPGLSKAWYNMGIIQMQAALKTFIDMENYTENTEPVHLRGKKMREGLLLLLQGSGQQSKGEE